MKRTLLATGVLLLIAIAGLWLSMNDPVDRCLDSGGAWDHAKKVCRR